MYEAVLGVLGTVFLKTSALYICIYIYIYNLNYLSMYGSQLGCLLYPFDNPKFSNAENQKCLAVVPPFVAKEVKLELQRGAKGTKAFYPSNLV